MSVIISTFVKNTSNVKYENKNYRVYILNKYFVVDKFTIISGGQKGVDISAINFAKKYGIKYDGFIPSNFQIPGMKIVTLQNIKKQYIERSIKNVDISDVTIAFYFHQTSSNGTLKTIHYCLYKKWDSDINELSECWKDSKKVFVVTNYDIETIKNLKKFLKITKPQKINICGNRDIDENQIINFLEKVLLKTQTNFLIFPKLDENEKDIELYRKLLHCERQAKIYSEKFKLPIQVDYKIIPNLLFQYCDGYNMAIPYIDGWNNFFLSTKSEVDKIFSEINKVCFFPERKNIFRIFQLVKPQNIKVIIIGQDPYINYEQATGVSFSVPNGVEPPPSLKNIFTEMKNDGFSVSSIKNGNLEKWCNQGVFLINTALTVQPGKSGSHSKIWIEFTRKLFTFLGETLKDIVVIMWGNHAQSFSKYFENFKKISSPHPSPLSAHHGFFRSFPFSKTNEFLKQLNKKPIDWNL